MSKTVLVACKLPSGIELDGTTGVILINGTNTAMVPGAPGLTHVEANEWAYLQATYAEHAVFKNNSVFTHGDDNVGNIIAMADELENEKTGLEGLDPTKPGAGLKPEDEGKLKQSLNESAEKPGVKSGKVKGADKAAALAVASAKGSK